MRANQNRRVKRCRMNLENHLGAANHSRKMPCGMYAEVANKNEVVVLAHHRH